METWYLTKTKFGSSQLGTYTYKKNALNDTRWIFILNDGTRISTPNFGTDICGKMFGINTEGIGVSQWHYSEFNREWHKAFKAGTTRTLVELPQTANNFQLVYFCCKSCRK
jgi:hypothetical protein